MSYPNNIFLSGTISYGSPIFVTGAGYAGGLSGMIITTGSWGTGGSYTDWSTHGVNRKLKEALEYIALLKEQREALKRIVSQ